MSTRGRSGSTLTGLSAIGLGIAAYLAYTKLSGDVPICGPLRGCETVNTSVYSEAFGVPVAIYGVAFSLSLVIASLAWWRSGDRRALYVAYGLGLVGVVAVGYLSYLEVFVIGAVCLWCVTYAATVLAGWVASALILRKAGGA